MDTVNFRKGNALLDRHGHVAIIKFIGEDDVHAMTKNILTGLPLEPIHLRSSIFLRTGAQNIDDTWYYDYVTHGIKFMEVDGYWYPTLIMHPEMSNENHVEINLNRIEYFHELQNLILTLFHKELEFTENDLY